MFDTVRVVAFPERSPLRGSLPGRERLLSVAQRVRPTVLAGERVVPVSGVLEGLLPGGGLQRGSVLALDGPVGCGVTSLALHLIAATTAAGEWAAFIDLDGSVGGLAAAEAGAVLDRTAVVRGVSPDRWAAVTASLVDGLTTVVAEVPPHCRPTDARRLVARVRERDAVLVVTGAWPAETTLTLRAVEGGAGEVGDAEGGWSGLTTEGGLLEQRSLCVAVEHRGVTRTVALAG